MPRWFSHITILSLVFGSVSLAMPTVLVADMSSTFDNDLEGWTAVGFDIDASLAALLTGNVVTVVDNGPDMVHDTGGDSDPAFLGNPGGFARLTDGIEDPGSFASAPEEYLGDLTSYLGGTISYDHRLFDEGDGASNILPYGILFSSGDPNDLNGYAAVFPGQSLGDVDHDWVTITANLASGGPDGFEPLSEIDLGIFDAGFAGDTINSLSGGLASTSMSFEEVMSNVTLMVLALEIVDNNAIQGAESGGIDNVFLTAPVDALPGDYNGNGIVDAPDYNVWRDNFGSQVDLAADGNNDGEINAPDYNVWRDNFGQSIGAATPEPGSLVLLVLAAVPAAFGSRRRRRM